MFKVGYGTVFLYLLSVTFFLLGIAYPRFILAGFAFSALFFVVASAIIGVMVKMRIGT